MKTIVFSFLFCVIIIHNSALAQSELILSGNTNAPPISWKDHDTLSGVAPDIARMILTDLNIPHKTVIVDSWSDVQENAKKGEIDIIVAAFKNSTRQEYLKFSIPYLPEPTVIITEQGKEFTFSSWQDLVGRKGVSNSGESYGQKFDTLIADKLDVDFLPLEKAIEQLNSGYADYLIMDLYSALLYSRLLRGEDAITILDTPVAQESFHIAIASNSPYVDRLPEINDRLKAALEDHTISTLFYKHFDRWKKLLEDRAHFFQKDKMMRKAENEEAAKHHEMLEKARLIELMGARDESIIEVDE